MVLLPFRRRHLGRIFGPRVITLADELEIAERHSVQLARNHDLQLCSSEGIFRKGELLLRVNASSTKHGNRRFLPLLFEALCFSFHVFESRLAVISQSVSQFCSHRVHLVCRLGFTMGNRVILTFRSDSDRTCNTLKTYRMKQGCRHLGILC